MSEEELIKKIADLNSTYGNEYEMAIHNESFLGLSVEMVKAYATQERAAAVKEALEGQWVDIEAENPACYATDILTGGTPFMVKYKGGQTGISYILDGFAWYYRAKGNGATHWMHIPNLPQSPKTESE